jgi:hypothetical protein
LNLTFRFSFRTGLEILAEAFPVETGDSPEGFVNSVMTNGVTVFMTDLAGQRPNRLSKNATYYC